MLSATKTNSATGTACASRSEPRRRVASAIRNVPGIAKIAYQPTPFQMCSREWCAISCASTIRTSSSANRPSSSVSQMKTLREESMPAANAFGESVYELTSSTRTGIGSVPCSCAYSRAAASSAGSRIGRSSGTNQGYVNEKRTYSATNVGAPATHQRPRSTCAKPITITSARQMKPNSPARLSQYASSHSRYPTSSATS